MGLFGLTGVEAKEPPTSSSWTLEPGAYVCRIDHADVVAAKSSGNKMLHIDYSVAEGPSAGFGASSQFPPSTNIMLEPADQLPYAVHRLNCISASNSAGPISFDAVKVVEDGNFYLLVGKLVGFVIEKELYTRGPGSKHPGEDGERNNVVKWLTAQEVRQGFTVGKDGRNVLIEVPPVKDSRKPKPAGAQAPQPEMADSDIPF